MRDGEALGLHKTISEAERLQRNNTVSRRLLYVGGSDVERLNAKMDERQAVLREQALKQRQCVPPALSLPQLAPRF